MFKLPYTYPNHEDKIEDLADFIEWECLNKKYVSITEITKSLIIVSDETEFEGIEDDTDRLNDKAEEVVQEFERRKKASGNNYPFDISNRGYSVYLNQNSMSYWIYMYLLISTRLNMKDFKTQNKIDGTTLLEFLSAETAKNYFGEKSKSMVFGTAQQGSFKDKVQDLCVKVGIGRGYKEQTSPVKAKDDKVDVIVWVDFTDKYPSKFVGFGQCKTGMSWDDPQALELQPEIFCKIWMIDPPAVTPIKMFFSSQSFPLDNYSKIMKAGLIFDRYRILDMLPPSIDINLLRDIIYWCNGAVTFIMKKREARLTSTNVRSKLSD